MPIRRARLSQSPDPEAIAEVDLQPYWPELLIQACRIIEREAPGLVALAQRLGVGREQLHRQFTLHLGISPKGYADTLKTWRLVRGLKRDASTVQIAFDAGFESTSAAYEATHRRAGAAPGELRGEIDIGWWAALSDLGWMLIGATREGICWLSFGEDPRKLFSDLQGHFPRSRLHPDESRLASWLDAVRDHVLLPRRALSLPLDIQGTAFQSLVWEAIRSVPLGSTISYTALAQRIEAPKSVRAVASACARNPVAILVPCHRIVDVQGGLAGYRWGVNRKQTLLAREGMVMPSPGSPGAVAV